MLYHAVQRQCLGSKDHNAILRAISNKTTANLTPTRAKKILDSYIKDFNGGKKWQELIDMFGGEGIVIVFVVAGMCLAQV